MSNRQSFAAIPIAITGISFRLPGGISTQSELWKALANAEDLVAEVPSSRFDPLAGLEHYFFFRTDAFERWPLLCVR